MKTGIIFSLCFAALCNTSFAQDSTISTKVYVGILSRNVYKNGTTISGVNLHVGGLAIWTISKKISYTSFAAVQLAKDGGFSVHAHFVEYKPTSSWKIATGFVPTLTTEQRPSPVSEGGQFETWTQALIPGIAPGVKIKKSFSSNTVFGTGFAFRNRTPEYHAGLQLHKVTLAGFYSKAMYGGAATYDGKKLYTIGVYKNAVVGNTTVITLIPKLKIKSFWDVGYDHRQCSLKRLELGLMKVFSAKHVDGLYSIAYDQQIHSITGYLFLYLNKKGL